MRRKIFIFVQLIIICFMLYTSVVAQEPTLPIESLEFDETTSIKPDISKPLFQTITGANDPYACGSQLCINIWTDYVGQVWFRTCQNNDSSCDADFATAASGPFSNTQFVIGTWLPANTTTRVLIGPSQGNWQAERWCRVNSTGTACISNAGGCGNWYLSPGEQCDAGPSGGGTCTATCQLDSDIDTIPDDSDQCDFEVGPGPHGCPDTDGDGVHNYDDLCPSSVGPGPHGCPDTDGDGAHDGVDGCPTQAGLAPSYCPLGVPTSTPVPLPTNMPIVTQAPCCVLTPIFTPVPLNDSDGDGTPDDLDWCPNVKGRKEANGCPDPGECQVAFYQENTPLRTIPSDVGNDPYITVPYSIQPMDIIRSVVGEDGFIWYLVEANTNGLELYVREDVVEVGKCETITNSNRMNREEIYQYFADAGCAITSGDRFNTLPDYTLALLIDVSLTDNVDLCTVVKENFITPAIAPSTPYDILKSILPHTPETDMFIEQLVTCDLGVIGFLSDLVQTDSGKRAVEALITSTNGKDPCEAIREWRIGDPTDPIDFPPDTPIEQQVDMGRIICGDKNMTQERYNELGEWLISEWEVEADDINCLNINSANHIGIPTDDQRILYDKLRECGFSDPIWRLERAIIHNNDVAEYAQAQDCSTFISLLNCTECPIFQLPPELNVCTVNEYSRAMMTIFVKNHVPLFNTEEIDLFYNATNPCHAVIHYLNTGEMPLPPIVPPPPPIDNNTPPDTDNDGFITNDDCPSEYGKYPNGCPVVLVEGTPIPTPIPTATPQVDDRPLDVPVQVLYSPDALRIRELTQPTMVQRVTQVYVNEDVIYVTQDNTPRAINTEPSGKKYAPILFEIDGVLVLAYILEISPDIVHIRFINLDEDDYGISILLPAGISANTQSKMTFYDSSFVFGGIDNVATTSNIYRITMVSDGMAETITGVATLFIENAKDPAPIIGLPAFIYTQVGGDYGNIFIFSNLGSSTVAVDDGLTFSCQNPVADQINDDWKFWFICDNAGQRELYFNSLRGTLNNNNSPVHSDMSGLSPVISPQNIALGINQDELFIDNGSKIYSYIKADGRKLIESLAGYYIFALR